MTDWKDIAVTPETPLRDAVACIDRAGLQIALVVEANGRLAGVLSDGDVRRAVLRGLPLTVPTSEVMNRQPTLASPRASRAELLGIMKRATLRHLPLVDDEGRVAGLATMEGLVGGETRSTWVVLMAGGLGARLMPLTETVPKPALPVNGKPILELTIQRFHEQGFRKFFIAVNYLAQTFKDHFGDGGRLGVDITYLHEERSLGTGGALSLLPEKPTEPMIVMNGDLLTRVRFDGLLDFHLEHGALATMAVREYDLQIPYGVVTVAGAKLTAVEEKPVQRLFVNAGIYAVSPECLSHVPPNTTFHMTALFERIISQGGRAAAYPLREYWIDIGRIEEYERAQREWGDEGQPA
jgi:dTDP-glucose pyrophosphorylase